jgi:hypothetical protein
VAAKLKEAVSVGRLVAMEAPDSAEAGRAAGFGVLSQLSDDCAVKRLFTVSGAFRAVDHQLLPDREAMLVGARQGVGGVEELPITLADSDALERDDRLAHHPAQFGQHPRNLVAGADRYDDHRDLGVGAEELRALADTVGGAIDAEQCGCSCDSSAVQ